MLPAMQRQTPGLERQLSTARSRVRRVDRVGRCKCLRAGTQFLVQTAKRWLGRSHVLEATQKCYAKLRSKCNFHRSCLQKFVRFCATALNAHPFPSRTKSAAPSQFVRSTPKMSEGRTRSTI